MQRERRHRAYPPKLWYPRAKNNLESSKTTMAQEAWELAWPPKHRYITGCGLANFKSQEGKTLQDINQLYQILTSKSAHLIWKLRCKRISDDKPENEWPKETKIHNQWLAIINTRLILDRATTSNKYSKKATKQKVVLDTWKNVLKNEKDLPQNWLKTPGVLVGIDPMVHPGGRYAGHPRRAALMLEVPHCYNSVRLLISLVVTLSAPLSSWRFLYPSIHMLYQPSLLTLLATMSGANPKKKINKKSRRGTGRAGESSGD